MKIAIHHNEGSFSSYWIKYCKEKNIEFKLVNCYDSNIISNLSDCDALMWHWYQFHSRDILFAKELIYSIEQMGKKVFPNFSTCLFFDDKLGQKYLFEALQLPSIPTYTFYYRNDALKWIKSTDLPKVFKLRGGASSVNVKLVKKKKNARRLINKAFSGGFAPHDRMVNLKDRISYYKKEKSYSNFIHVLKGFVRIFHPNEHDRARHNEKSYIYFQDFIPNLKFDIRVNVIGDRAFAMKRKVRSNDFRASGGGSKIFDPSEIDYEYIKLAFELNKKLKMQSVAFDFIKDDMNIYLVEVSYSFVSVGGEGKWPGYWTDDCKWHEGSFFATDFMIEDLINEIKE